MAAQSGAQFSERQVVGWLRGSSAGRDLLAQEIAKFCKDCKRLESLQLRCLSCQHRASVDTTAEILDRIPPSNFEAEVGVIGSVLLDPSGKGKIIKELEPEDFYYEANGIIWQAIRSLVADGKPVDTTLVSEVLRKIGKFDYVGGTKYLLEILHNVAVPSHIEHYASIVKEKSQLRKAIRVLCDILRACYDSSASLEKGGPVRALSLELLGVLGV